MVARCGGRRVPIKRILLRREVLEVATAEPSGSIACGEDDSDTDLLVVMLIFGSRRDATVRVLNDLRDLPFAVDATVVDLAHLDEEASVPGVVRAAIRDGHTLGSLGAGLYS